MECFLWKHTPLPKVSVIIVKYDSTHILIPFATFHDGTTDRNAPTLTVLIRSSVSYVDGQ